MAFHRYFRSSVHLLLAFTSFCTASLSLFDFADPPSTARPKARYWIKDASGYDPAVGRYDLSELQRVGFGGAEVVDFASYHGTTIEDPAYYSIGSGNWSELFESLVDAAVDLGVHLDFCLGASSGAAAVTSFNPRTDPGLEMGVVYGYEYFGSNTSYNGLVPDISRSDFGKYNGGRFVAAVLGKLGVNSTADDDKQTLLYSSMIDLTDDVKCLAPENDIINCTVSFTTPSDTGNNDTYALISFWTLGAASQEASGGFNGADPNLPASAGLYYTDHFATAGANATAMFFKNTVFSDLVERLLPRLPKPSYAWQDSLEFGSVGKHWGIDMGDRWASVRSYGPGLALPSLFTNKWVYDNITATAKMLNDYKYVLTDGYRAYALAMTEWSHSLGIEYSQQPYGYKAPSMDIAGLAIAGDAPETESLDFSNSIDGMRHMSGGVHTPTSGGIFSEELGAAAGKQYQVTWPNILSQVQPGIAAGVNMLNLHGYSYSGYHAETTWPGYTAFGASYGNSWGPRDPEWNHSKPVVDFIARNFLIAQTGKAKLDLAFWSWNAMDKSGTSRNSFVTAGYSYEYLSTMSLEHENNMIQDGKLNPDNAGYRALVFPGIEAIETSGFSKVLEFAKQGFPMVFYQSKPSASTNLEKDGDALVQSIMAELLTLDNVVYVDTEAEAVAALATLGVKPTTAFSQSTAFYSTHRATDDLDIVWLYNSNSGETTMNITFAFNAMPFELNAWTGALTPVAVYTRSCSQGTVTIPITIPGGASCIYAFGNSQWAKSNNVTVTATHLIWTDVSYPTVIDGRIVLRETQNTTRHVRYSNGSSMAVEISQVPAPKTLSGWNLTIVSFNPPSNFSESDHSYPMIYETSSWEVNTLVSWLDIDPALTNVSGVGTYVTSFDFAGTASGAFLNLTGKVFDTVDVIINGEQTDPLNLWKPVIDITKYLRTGRNEVQIIVTTTLNNIVSSVADRIESAGDSGSGYGSKAKQEYGLIGDVDVNFYQIANV